MSQHKTSSNLENVGFSWAHSHFSAQPHDQKHSDFLMKLEWAKGLSLFSDIRFFESATKWLIGPIKFIQLLFGPKYRSYNWDDRPLKKKKTRGKRSMYIATYIYQRFVSTVVFPLSSYARGQISTVRPHDAGICITKQRAQELTTRRTGERNLVRVTFQSLR